WLSTLKPPSHSGLRYRPGFSPSPTRRLSEAPRVHIAAQRRGGGVAARGAGAAASQQDRAHRLGGDARPSADYRTYGLPNALVEAVGMPGRGPIGSPNSTERPSCSEPPSMCEARGPPSMTNTLYYGHTRTARCVCACVGSAIFLLATLGAAAAETKRVLMLHSFDRDVKPWSAYAKKHPRGA